MPLSGLDWDLSLSDSECAVPQGHLVQGLKRKGTWDAQLQACSGENVLIEYTAKRQCKDNHFVNSIFPPVMAPALLESSPADQVHEEMEVHSLYGCMKYTAVSSQHKQEADSQPHLDSRSQLLPLENNLLMDLGNEIYSSNTHDQDLDSIHSAMESDSVPDTQQRPNIGYCCTPCPGGERSPNSNRVRCYCRPALDPIFDIGPYCSDYY